MIIKQGRVFLLLAALTGAALFLFSACNGDEKIIDSAIDSALAGARSGIGPDAAGGGLMYEEEPFTGFNDYLSQIDYSIAKAIQLSGNSLDNLKVKPGPAQEYEGHIYHPNIIILHGVKNIPALRQAINDSLLAWAERAAIVSPAESVPGGPGEVALQVVVDDFVLTHYIFLSSLPVAPRDDRPRLVIVMDDLGESKRHARRLLNLDFPVTFAIWPRSTHAEAVAKMGHEDKAEIVVHQPMEPMGYPGVNPGEGVILESMSVDEITAVLEDNLSRVPYASGFNNHMGSRLTQNETAMHVVSHYAQSRGLVVLDSLTHAKSRFARVAADAGVQTYKRDIFLDVEADKNKIIGQLKKAEQIALIKGQAIAIGHPLAATLEALEEWQHDRDNRVALVRLIDLTSIQASNNLPAADDKN